MIDQLDERDTWCEHPNEQCWDPPVCVDCGDHTGGHVCPECGAPLCRRCEASIQESFDEQKKVRP